MNKENISSYQGICLMAMFICGSAIILGIGNPSRQDAWIAVSIAMVMSLPVLFIYARLIKIFPDKDIFDILHEIFGSFLGKTIALLYVWYTFHLGALVIRNFSEFIQIASLPETPQYVLVTSLGIICIWAVKEGLEVIGRCAALVFPFFLVTFFIVQFVSLPQEELINLKPILGNGWSPVISNAFGIFSFPFAETVVFTAVMSGLNKKKSIFKVFFIGLVLGGSILLFINIRHVLILGVAIKSNMYFPAFSALRVIGIGDFVERMEIIIAIVFTFGGMAKICTCLYAASKGLARVLNIDNYRKLAVPVGLLMMELSLFIYKNVMEMVDWAVNIYKYYALPFQVILPIIILIFAEIKTRSKGKHKAL